MTKGIRLAAKMTCLGVSPKGENISEMFKPILLVLLWPPKRSGVSDMVEVVVQALCEYFYTLFLESPTPFIYELDLWGSGILGVGHWDEAAGGYLPEDPEASPGVAYYIPAGKSAATGCLSVLFNFPKLAGNPQDPGVQANKYKSRRRATAMN